MLKNNNKNKDTDTEISAFKKYERKINTLLIFFQLSEL